MSVRTVAVAVGVIATLALIVIPIVTSASIEYAALAAIFISSTVLLTLIYQELAHIRTLLTGEDDDRNDDRDGVPVLRTEGSEDHQPEHL